METTLRTLYQLQQIDSSLDEFEEMKGDLPSRIASLDEEIGKISEKIQQQEHRMNEAIVSRNKADTDIVDLKEKLEKYKGQQYQVRNNKEYDAITKEIEVAEKTIITLQDEFAALENVMSVAKNDVEQLSVQLLQLKTEREEKQKEYKINSNTIQKLSSVIGEFPIVIISPEHATITMGSPAERRKFIDITISQSNKMYVENMMEYKKILRQRNKLFEIGNVSLKILEPWNEMLVKYGSKIIAKRIQFFKEIFPIITKSYASLIETTEEPSITYIPQSENIEEHYTVENIAEILRKEIEKIYKDEVRLKNTLVGPHRDDVVFYLNTMNVREFASQGQHKTFLIALKIAEFLYIKEQCNETPVFLLDDVFSELDEIRTQKLLSIVENLGQTFITTTNEKIFGDFFVWNDSQRKFSVKNGSIVNEKVFV